MAIRHAKLKLMKESSPDADEKEVLYSILL
jgi:hypothetical protein